MLDLICRLYWENNFFHYFFFGFIGPLVGIILIFTIRGKLKSASWLKALSGFMLINLASCAISWKANKICQIQMFGEVGDDPGDVGVVFLTLPLFLICFVIGILTIFFIRRRTKSKRVVGV